MKILYMTYETPFFPGGTGGETRQYHILKELKDLHEFHFLGPRVQGEKLATLNLFFRKIITPGPNTLFTRACSFTVKHLDKGYPRFVQVYEWHRMRLMPLLNAALAEGQYDLIHVEHTNIAHWLHGITTSVPRVLVGQNVKSVLWERYYQGASGAQKKMLFKDYNRFKEYERTYLRDYDALVAVSEKDKGYMIELCDGKVPVFVVPNGCDIEYFQPTSDSTQTQGLIFTGTMHYQPNVDAMLYFCRDIFPKILVKEPTCQLSIVGNAPPPEIKALGKLPNVVVTGFVPDIRPYLAVASVVVVPLLSGSGTRLKILEAMAMGKAVVSTTVGAEGIEYVEEQNIIIADNAVTFAARTLELLTNSKRCVELGEKARKLAEEKYSWKSAAQELDNVYAYAGNSVRNK